MVAYKDNGQSNSIDVFLPYPKFWGDNDPKKVNSRWKFVLFIENHWKIGERMCYIDSDKGIVKQYTFHSFSEHIGLSIRDFARICTLISVMNKFWSISRDLFTTMFHGSCIEFHTPFTMNSITKIEIVYIPKSDNLLLRSCFNN